MRNVCINCSENCSITRSSRTRGHSLGAIHDVAVSRLQTPDSLQDLVPIMPVVQQPSRYLRVQSHCSSLEDSPPQNGLLHHGSSVNPPCAVKQMESWFHQTSSSWSLSNSLLIVSTPSAQHSPAVYHRRSLQTGCYLMSCPPAHPPQHSHLLMSSSPCLCWSSWPFHCSDLSCFATSALA